jgi:hypothetical protein
MLTKIKILILGSIIFAWCTVLAYVKSDWLDRQTIKLLEIVWKGAQKWRM